MRAAKPTPGDLDALAQERLDDAEALFASGRYAGAMYLGGYAVEMTLKARICRVHQWSEYPPNVGDRLEQALKTHNLEDLLLLSGDEPTILMNYPGKWAMVAAWSPEQRYRRSDVTAQEAQEMLTAIDALMAAL